MARRALGAPSRRLFWAGVGAYRQGAYPRARRLLTLDLRLAPGNRMARLYLARAERELRRPDASLATISRALARDPGWPPGIRHTVDLQLRLGRDEDARRTIEAAIEAIGDESPSDNDLLRIWLVAIDAAPDLAVRLVERLSGRAGSADRETIAREATARGGDERDGLAIGDELAARGEPGTLAAAIRIYGHWGQLHRALDLVPALNGAPPAELISVARVLRERGFFLEALKLLERSGDAADAPAMRAQIRAQTRALDGWRPRVPRAAVDPVPGRVLHLAHFSLPYTLCGYTVRTHESARAQRAVGLDPHVVTRIGFPEGGRGGLDLVDGIPYHRLLYEGAKQLPSDERLVRHAERAAATVRKVRPQVLHPASDYQNAIIALALRDATGIPVVYEVRGFWEDTWLSRQPPSAEISDLYRLRREANLRCMREADHVVTLAETMKRAIVERGVDPEKVSVVPNAVDAHRLRPGRRDARAAEALGLDTARVTVGYVGSLVDYEGLDALIEATALLHARGHDVQCLIVGAGPERASLATLAAERGIADRVALPGRVPHDEVLRCYRAIDIYAMPRRDLRVCNLVAPLKPYEAMAAGCAVVVSDVEVLAEIVTDEVTGLVVRADDRRSLAAAIERLIADPARRDSLADAAAEWVRRERSWERNGIAYRVIYERLAARRPVAATAVGSLG